MPTLADLRNTMPELDGLDDANAIDFIHRAYYPTQAPATIMAALKYEPPKPASDRGQFASGFNRSFAEVPGLAAGVGGFVADAVGADDTRDSLMAYAKRKSDELAGQHASDASSLTDAWDGKSSWVDWLANSAGYVAGQALQSVVSGGFGAIAGRIVATTAIKQAAAAAAAKAIATGASESVARAAATKAVLASATNVGAVAGAGAHNLGMEVGSIYPEAVDQAKTEGRQLDGGDLFRVAAAASLAAGVDTAGEAIMAGRVFRGSKAAGGIGARAAREVPAGMVREAGTEAIQTGLEHYGAGVPIADEKGIKDIIDSAGVGAVGGGLGGGAASFHKRATEAKADAAFRAIGDAPDVASAVEAFNAAVPPLDIPGRGLDGDGAMRRSRGFDDAGIGGGFDPATGEMVPFAGRLADLRSQLEDSRVRQQIRDTSGSQALNDILYYLGRADDATLPGKTSDRMLALAERLVLRAQTTPIGGIGTDGGPGLIGGPPPGPPRIGLDTTPTGTMRVDSGGTAAPEVRADVISDADRARAARPITVNRAGDAAAPGATVPPAGVRSLYETAAQGGNVATKSVDASAQTPVAEPISPNVTTQVSAPAPTSRGTPITPETIAGRDNMRVEITPGISGADRQPNGKIHVTMFDGDSGQPVGGTKIVGDIERARFEAAKLLGNIAPDSKFREQAKPGTAARGTFGSLKEANDYLSQQRRDASIRLPAALPYQADDGTVTVAHEGDLEFPLAQKQEAEREKAAKKEGTLKERAAKLAAKNKAKPTTTVAHPLIVTMAGKSYPVASVDDAKAKWETFRDKSAAGVSQIGNGVRITDTTGKFVARVSYNGRIHTEEDAGPVAAPAAIENTRGKDATTAAATPSPAPEAGTGDKPAPGKSEAPQIKPFDSEAWNKARDDTIKASRAAGNVHLDKVPAAVETMRGKAIYYAHNPKQRGVIRTVDNRGSVLVYWGDDYSAEKEMAVPMKDGKKDVRGSWLGPTDLKDYVLGEAGKSETPPATGLKDRADAMRGTRSVETADGTQYWIKGVTIEGGAVSGDQRKIAKLTSAEITKLRNLNQPRLEKQYARDARPEGPAERTDPGTWWQNELTVEGRRQALKAIGKGAIKPEVRWQYLPKDAKEALEGLIGTDRDPIVSEAEPAATADAPPERVEPPAPKAEPSANTIFTEEAAAAARAVLKKKLGQLNSGIDPEIIQAGITLAGYHVEKGARAFGAFAKAMVDDLGDAIKPYLKSFYMAVKYDPRATEFAPQMSDEATIDADPLFQPTAEALPTAEVVAAAQAAPFDVLTLDEGAIQGFAGKTVEIPVQVGDTGKTAMLKMDAADAVRDVQKRVAAAAELLRCLS